MQKMTLLDMVQNIGSAMDTDEISSISDTVESLQIAEVIKETFYEQFNNILVPEFRGLIRLDDVSDLSMPNYLKVPLSISKIEWIKYYDYKGSAGYRDVDYVEPDDFLNRQLQYNSGSSNTFLTMDPSGVEYYIKANGRPQYYTMFDDQYLAFDSFDLDEEDTLQSSKTIAFGLKNHEFELNDDYVPPIDGSLFPLLLAEAKSTCFINLKQISSSKEEQRARRQRIRMQNDQFKTRKAQRSYYQRGPNYARNR